MRLIKRLTVLFCFTKRMLIILRDYNPDQQSKQIVSTLDQYTIGPYLMFYFRYTGVPVNLWIFYVEWFNVSRQTYFAI